MSPPAPAGCPCGSGRPYPGCCGRLHDGSASAATAEELMRSRYSAFALGRAQYLLDTWHPSTRPAALQLERARSWTRLEVLSARGGLFDSEGAVAFRAHWQDRGARGVQAEDSAFVREGGRWLYVGPVSA